MKPQISHSRRRFISGTLGSAGMLGLRPVLQAAPLDSGVLKKLGGKLKGRAIVASDNEYEQARRVFYWNPVTSRRPGLVVRCAQPSDVSFAVEFAQRHSLEIAVRGGGHSLMGWGTSDGIVLDLTQMDGVAIDPATRTARLDAGVLSGKAMQEAGRYGLAPVLGQCPGVGAAGLTLGGGLGWLSGLHGAACDNLISVRMIRADGSVLLIDQERNPELFWALKGAGANFGVVTSIECRLHPVGPVTSGDIYYPARESREVLRFFRNFMAEAPDSFQATLNLTPGERGVFVSLCHAGGAPEVDRMLEAFRRVATPSRSTVKRQEFAELASRTPAAAAGVSFRSVATAYRSELSDSLMEQILDRLAEAPAETVIGISHYMHGEVCRVNPMSSAYPLREAGAVHIRIGMDWNEPDDSDRLMRWAEEAAGRLRPSSGARIYANYQSHQGKGSAAAVFGGSHSRLAKLKKQYDPYNVFRRNSNIEPA